MVRKRGLPSGDRYNYNGLLAMLAPRIPQTGKTKLYKLDEVANSYSIKCHNCVLCTLYHSGTDSWYTLARSASRICADYVAHRAIWLLLIPRTSTLSLSCFFQLAHCDGQSEISAVRMLQLTGLSMHAHWLVTMPACIPRIFFLFKASALLLDFMRTSLQ